MHENQYFEIDVYPFWNDRAIMEIELSNADDNIVFPEYIDIIKEVTSDPSYKNAALASL
jgi:CYTH domain-containing protein